MISANVAPLARFISEMTSVFLVARSVFGLPAFLARPAFFAGLAVLVDLRLLSGCWASGAGGPFSIESLIIGFSVTGLRSSHRSLRFGEIATRFFAD
jgi:hypothetical protein